VRLAGDLMQRKLGDGFEQSIGSDSIDFALSEAC